MSPAPLTPSIAHRPQSPAPEPARPVPALDPARPRPAERETADVPDARSQVPPPLVRASDPASLFVPEAGGWLPTALSRGPWSADALHGGPVAALVARAVEGCEPDSAMHVARLTVELRRPVPLTPLTVAAVLSRPGHKVQVIDVSVAAGSTLVATARAVRIRMLAADEAPAVDVSGPVPGQPGAPAPPGAGRLAPALGAEIIAFHTSGAELRFVDGTFRGRGPARVWVRLAVPVVPDEEPSPLQRAAAAADFGNGVSAVVDFERYVFVNPDLTVYLERPPVGEWVCLDASTRLGATGVGLAHSVLWDERRQIGRSLQSLVVQARPDQTGE